jgi:hypothetical protein
MEFIIDYDLGLDVVLRDIELSEEKFMRIVTLLRKIGHITGGFAATETEWSYAKIKRKIAQEPDFAHHIAELLIKGKKDSRLKAYIPRYYLETLNYGEIRGSSLTARRIRYKSSLIGTYGGKKGYKVENLIRQKLTEIQVKYGVPFAQGRSRTINTDIDFASPTLDDPRIILMSSFQETTSSGQTTKVRDMLDAYVRVIQENSRHGEDRVFINLVDGGGWLARKRDLRRLVDQCHYFLNLAHLDMLESIVTQHVPREYFRQ